jgi:adenosylhomocysteine nucleosidase
MPMELAPLRRRMTNRRLIPELGPRAVTGQVASVAIVATTVGVGTRAAVEATERLLRSVSVPLVVVVGIAGASAPHLRVGDVVVPETVIHGPSDAPYTSTALGGTDRMGTILTSDDLLVDAEAVAALHRRGITAMDMETGAIAAVCDRHGVPWTAFRAISDTIDRPVDKDVMTMLSRDGTPNVGAALRFIARRPHRIPHLVSMARDSTRACQAAAAAAEKALAGFAPKG